MADVVACDYCPLNSAPRLFFIYSEGGCQVASHHTRFPLDNLPGTGFFSAAAVRAGGVCAPEASRRPSRRPQAPPLAAEHLKRTARLGSRFGAGDLPRVVSGRKCARDPASSPEIPLRGRLRLLGFPAAVCPSRSPVARPGGVTRGWKQAGRGAVGPGCRCHGRLGPLQCSEPSPGAAV